MREGPTYLPVGGAACPWFPNSLRRLAHGPGRASRLQRYARHRLPLSGDAARAALLAWAVEQLAAQACHRLAPHALRSMRQLLVVTPRAPPAPPRPAAAVAHVLAVLPSSPA